MTPVYNLPSKFWEESSTRTDVNKLQVEALTVREYAHKIPYTYLGKPYGNITALPLIAIGEHLDHTRVKIGNELVKIPLPELAKFKYSFLEAYPAIPSLRGLSHWGDYTTAYMWIDKDYPWHTDNIVTISKTSGKGVKCALNVLLGGLAAPVEFKINGQISSHTYEAAVLNTSETHRVNPFDGERVMARISFKDKTFEEVTKGIESWEKKNI